MFQNRLPVLISALLLLGTAHAAPQPPDTSVDALILSEATIGETILHEDFAQIPDGSLPEGWGKDFPFPFLWAATKATGLVGDNITVENHQLLSRSTHGAHIQTLPALGTPNYMFTATFQFISPSGSFGLVTDLEDDYKSARFATNSMMYGYETPEGEFAQFIRLQNGVNYGGRDLERRNNDCANGYFPGPLPAVNTDIVFTAYHLNGVTIFYCNGKYVSQLADYNSATTPRTRIGFYNCGGFVRVSSVTVKKLLPKTLFEKGLTDALSTDNVSLQFHNDVCSMQVSVILNKTNGIARQFPQGLSVGLLASSWPLTDGHGKLTFNTPRVVNLTAPADIKMTEQSATCIFTCPPLTPDLLSRTFVLRPYLMIMNKAETTTLLSQDQSLHNPVTIANTTYRQMPADDQARANKIFAAVESYQGPNTKSLTFAMFSDFHYKKGMYASRVTDLQTIIDRTADSKVDFIIHAGDFCNDYKGSPELTSTYLRNTRGLPAYGLYGNHELETGGNIMAVVTPLLTNRPASVVWGTEDGKIGDGSIAYYYFDLNGFRVICTDTNYSWNPTKQLWEHNTEASWGPPKGNVSGNSLAPEQLAWLEKTIMDAAEKSLHCIVLGHDSVSGVWGSSPDTSRIQAIYRKANELRSGTVMMSINGHYHTDHLKKVEHVLYWDVNTVFNGEWQGGQTQHHYTDGMVFDYDEYDKEGKYIRTVKRNLHELLQAKNTWFFNDPLSAIVTIDSLGNIVINGSQTTWRYNVIPGRNGIEGCTPCITNTTINVLE